MKRSYNKGGLSTLLGENKEEQELRKQIQQIEQQYKRDKEERKKQELEPLAKQYQESKKDKRGRPKTNHKEVKSESERGTLAGETRATFIVKEEHLTKLKQIAYWNRQQLKQVVAEALLEAITKYEKKNGTLKKIPQ